MKKSNILIPLLLLNSTFTMANNDTVSTRVVGGQESAVGSWPWMVRVKSGGYVCGGTLIDNKTVLTAAHCLFDDGREIPSYKISVVVGEYDLESIPENTQKSIKRTIIHEGYDPDDNSSRHDIALLRLSHPVNNTLTIPALELSTTRDAISRQDNVTVMGWGSTVAYAPLKGVTPKFPDRLMEAVLPLQTDEQCTTKLGNRYDSKTMLCAAPALGGIDSCQGDSGGPLVYNENNNGNHSDNWKQIGIVSWGFGCASAGYPGVYTRLAVYKSWIERFLNDITIDNQLYFNPIVYEQRSKSLKISNNADREAQLTFNITSSSPFTFNQEKCATIASGATCLLPITYSPQDTSIAFVTLSIESDLPNSTAVYTVIKGRANELGSSHSGGGGGSLLFLLSIPLLFIRRYFTKVHV